MSETKKETNKFSLGIFFLVDSLDFYKTNSNRKEIQRKIQNYEQMIFVENR